MRKPKKILQLCTEHSIMGEERLKKSVTLLVVLLLIIIVVIATGLSISNKQQLANKRANKEYEQYLEQDIYGTEVVSIINKAIDNNQKNHIATDNQGNYIPDEENSLLVEVVMITNEEKHETTTYKMEAINKVGIADFMANFNTTTFKVTQIQYHPKTKKVSNITIEQQGL